MHKAVTTAHPKRKEKRNLLPTISGAVYVVSLPSVLDCFSSRSAVRGPSLSGTGLTSREPRGVGRNFSHCHANGAYSDGLSSFLICRRRRRTTPFPGSAMFVLLGGLLLLLRTQGYWRTYWERERERASERDSEGWKPTCSIIID